MQTASIGTRPACALGAPRAAPAGVDPQTGEVLDATFPPELLRAAYAPMVEGDYRPVSLVEAHADAKVRQITALLNKLLEFKKSVTSELLEHDASGGVRLLCDLTLEMLRLAYQLGAWQRVALETTPFACPIMFPPPGR